MKNRDVTCYLLPREGENKGYFSWKEEHVQKSKMVEAEVSLLVFTGGFHTAPGAVVQRLEHTEVLGVKAKRSKKVGTGRIVRNKTER